MKLSNLFAKKQSDNAAVQTAVCPTVNGINRVNVTPYDAKLYEALRCSVPIIDAAIDKIVRLTGTFSVRCRADRRLESALNRFLKTVRVNSGSNGIDVFLTSYLDQMLTYGTAVGEIVPGADAEDIAALYNADINEVEFKIGKTPFDVSVCRRDAGIAVPAPYQELILFTPLRPDPGKVTGNSIMRSMPFTADILLKIYNAVGNNFERLGNLRYAVTYHPASDADRVSAKERASQIASEWSNAMQSAEVRDFVAVGDVQVKVIGADAQMMSTEVPVRQMLEQIVAKTGLPPFLLGLTWSSTERMSSQQADILTSELEFYRTLLTPVIRKICDVWQRMHGRTEWLDIEWEPINLQDETELNKARLYRAQAMRIEQSLKGEKDEQ